MTHADTLETASSNASTCCANARREISSVSSNPAQPRVIAGKYRLDELLGEGGMGAIWQAFNLQLELQVAIKLLRPGFQSAELAERLRSEARVAAGLVHPNIVRVFDVGESEAGEPFIVMELLRGESLAQMLTRGPLSPINVVRLLLPIADALSVAHARGVVHRDVKPDNVFVTGVGQLAFPKLLDFGIAKVQGVPSGTGRKLTLSGTLLGSPDYMSPEQAAGHPDLDHRSDTWSFCVMLHEALSGQPPFSAPTLRGLRRSIAEQTPPSLELVGVDPMLASVVRHGLEKDRNLRPASIGELGRALASWLAEQGVESDAAGSSLSAKWLEPREAVERPCPSSVVRASEHHEPITLISDEPHLLRVPRLRSWPTALGAAITAAALGALVASLAAGNFALPDSGAPLAAQVRSTAPLGDIERGCPAPAATAALALAPLDDSADHFAYSTARLQDTVQARATTVNAAQAVRSSNATEMHSRAELPF